MWLSDWALQPPSMAPSTAAAVSTFQQHILEVMSFWEIDGLHLKYIYIYIYMCVCIHTHTHIYGAGHIIRISSKS